MQLDARIAGESRRGDVLFTERRSRPGYRRKLGLLGELARGRVLFELFRNPPPVLELQSCVLKAVDLKARDARSARRAKQPRSSVEALSLCVITPSMSGELAAQAGAAPRPSAVRGLYTLAPMWRTVIVVVNELPDDRSTVWLRLLGRGAVQAGAVRQLLEMPERGPLRDGTLRLLVAWQQSLPPPWQQSEEERELSMNWEQVYERWERKVLAKGRAEGRAEAKAEGKAEAVLAVLAGRGLTITAAQRKQVLSCSDNGALDAWLRSAGTAPSVKALLSGTAPPRPRDKGREKARSKAL
ncbi:MAG TPA: hypothetical protein VE093_44510 [Polyangiaceae bacterium]|nr:hypothetical protein [Polyangiaceae bacterium]